MKSFFKNTILIISLLFISSTIFSQEKENNIYKGRRDEFIRQMETGSIAVFEAADVKSRNSDTDYKFKQEATFQYFTGISEPISFLILFNPALEVNGTKISEVLFVREKNPMAEQWTGEILGEQKAKTISMADTVISSNLFTDFFKKYASDRKVLYLGKSDYSPYKDRIADIRYNYYDDRKKKLKSDFPNLQIKSLFDIMADMREIKSSQEIADISKAIEATASGYIEAMKSCKPEMYEYQLEAIIEYAFRFNGCEYYAFPSIVGSGPNALTLHYEKNNRKMLSGDLVLMDIGAEYKGYAADITRTIPVNGKFTKEQKEIYSLVLKAQTETIKIMVAGSKPAEIEKKAMDVITDGLMSLGILKNKKDARRYMPHGVSHNVGLDVHDVSTSKPLRPGQVLTIEPGIYIPLDSKEVDKKYLGIGVRIEDDILVTEKGNIILSEKAPKKIEEIEKIMAETGIGNIEIGNYKK